MMRRIAASAILFALASSRTTATQARPTSAAAARAADTGGCAAAQTRPLEPRRFAFPRDDGAHDGYAVEWWRTFGLVVDDAGERFDISVNVSRYAADTHAVRRVRAASRWAAHRVVSTSYEILDERTLAVERGTFVEREGPLGAVVARDRLSLATGAFDYAYAGSGGRERFALSLRDAAAANAVALVEKPVRAALALGPGGVVRTGSCVADAAYAYAYTRNETHGSLRFEGTDRRVSGSMWFEHEFAHEELATADTGWNRYELQFDDGRDVDVRFTRDSRGDVVATSGVFVAANGGVTYLGPGSADVTRPPAADAASADWHSDATGATYPSIWYLSVRPGRLGLATVEVTHDQEVRVPGRTPYYWGAIVVEKADPPGGDAGHGFVELTGYAGRRAL